MMKYFLLTVAFIAATVSATNFELQAENVCFGAAGTSFGKFTASKSGKMTAIKLVHKNGAITCREEKFGFSNWGCGKNHLDYHLLSTVVTTATDKIIFPKKVNMHGYYSLAGFDAKSKELLLANPTENNKVSKGQTLRLWYGEDLTHTTEQDNSGISCADVYAKIVPPDFQLQANNVCFGDVGVSPGEFTVTKSGIMTAIKLVHKNETITCRRETAGLSNWGCGNDFNIVVTTDTGKVWLTKGAKMKDGNYYVKTSFNSKAKKLICNNIVSKGQTLRLWHGNDFKNFVKSDNNGNSCADVYAEI